MNYYSSSSSAAATALVRRACACACRATGPSALTLSPQLIARRWAATRSLSRSRRTSVRQQQQQHRAFSSTCLLHQAQPVSDLPPTSSEGLDASILHKASAGGANVAPSVLSRAPTDPNVKKSSSASIPQNPPYTPPAPSSPKAKTTAPSSWDPSLIYPSATHEIPDADAEFLSTSPTLVGTVTRTGTMQKTVRVTRHIQVWHAQFQKHYTRATHSLVHDAHNLLREGDVVRFGAFPPSLRQARDARGQLVVKRHRPRDRNGVVKEKGVRYVVRDVLTPFGVPVEQRRERSVGSEAGRWRGTEGEVKKLALRQKGRRDGGKGSSSGSASKKHRANANQSAAVDQER
ncbi:hypothetical protein AYL99_07608 [Fonsecaea erecta]|uniref:30S ribosomal protein S17 n=1 Tax=Fonsecaea erecta TaxID=1367422 RepID=A0A178ZFI0_9EURO|nr:hypothetical protein AYL99_07608 [Fonsecaea erecta]OAP58518.1 hypothetical protein AYL99_07608 [Fonsecaea erecta]